MKTFSIKEICTLARVSVRTLHYYDKLGLLKPSARLPNGYRVYSEADLLTLEKIIALKFLGFMLLPISQILQSRSTDVILEKLKNQMHCLQNQIAHIEEGQKKILACAIQDLEQNNAVNWQALIDYIHGYAKKMDGKEREDELLDELKKEQYHSGAFSSKKQNLNDPRTHEK